MTSKDEKPLVWLHGEIETRVDADAVLILEVFAKKSQATPKDVSENCQHRIKLYDKATGGRR